MARSLVAWFVSVAAVVLVFEGCATGEDSGLGGGVGGGGYGNSGTECEPPTCNCGTCYGTCVCAGTDPQQCLHVCAGSNDSGLGGAGGGSGGSPLFGGGGGGGGGAGGAGSGGGSGGSGAVGGAGAVGGSGNAGGSGAVGGAGGGGSGGVGNTGGAGGSGGSGTGTCCSPKATPGCSNASIQSCVCATDSYCCTDEWDDICVDEVDSEGCGTCGAGGGGGTGGGTSTCSVELTDPLCNACMQQACCAPAEGCFDNPSCSALISCILTACPAAASVAEFSTCADVSCSQFSTSKPLLMSYLNCISTSCASSCGL